MRRLHFFLALVAFVGAACTPDTLTQNDPETGKVTLPAGLQPTHIGDADLAAMIQADLSCLYNDAGLLPNESSSLGKFNNIMNLLAADDLQGAIDATNNLIAFIELKYSQYKDKDAVIECGGPGGEPVDITDLKDRAVTRLNAYVNLTGAVCEIPPGYPEAYCEAEDQSSFVYFPPGLFEKLTYVSVEENPPGFTKLQDVFDEYPTYVRIVTEPIADFSDDLLYPVKPLVIVCHDDQLVPNDASLRARLLLGALHASGFELLPPVDFSQYDAGVETFAENFCNPAPAPTFGFSSSTLMGRLANRVLDFVMPRPIQAQYEMAFGGVGGSPEEFSEFGAVDAGMEAAFGGAGGSPEEFAPPVGAAPSATPPVPAGNTFTGKVGTQLTNQLFVTLATGTGTPIAGATVTFTLSDPTTAPYDADPSEASLCAPTDSPLETTVVTDADGKAILPCLEYGDELGYQNLSVSVDPTTVDPSGLPCVYTTDPTTGVDTSCNLSLTVHFLIQTVAGDPAQLAVVNTPGSTSAVAGSAMNPQPIVEVQDAGGNPVGTLSSAVSVSAAVSAGGSLSGTTTAAADLGTGQATFTNLGLGGTVGTAYTITFSATGLASATASVTVSGPGPAASLAVSPTTVSATAGGQIPAITATVQDAFNNGVPSVGVTVAATDLACFAGAGCTSGNTGAGGTVSFGDLSIQGSGTSRTLTFSSTGLTDATATVNLSPGPASVILIDRPTGGAYTTPINPFTAVSPTPRVLVQDAWQNNKPGATVLWQRTGDLTNGGSVSSASTSTDASGLASTGWTLGDGGNGLSAYLGSLSGPSVAFTAGTLAGTVVQECAATTNLKKADIGTYDGTKWTGKLTVKPELVGRYRRVTLQMSVTGQSSGTGDYPSVMRIYRWESGAKGAPLGTGAPDDPQQLIRLPGDNGSPNAVHWVITPNLLTSVMPGNTNDVLIEVEIVTPSNRTPTLWYNSKAVGGFCSNAKLWAPGVTPLSGNSPKDRNDGLLIKITN